MFADHQPPHAAVSAPEPEVVCTEPEAKPLPHEPTSRRTEPLPLVYGPGDNLRAGVDHGVWLDGRQTAILLASLYPSEFDLQREKRAFQKANPGTDIQVRSLRQIP